MGNLAIKKTLPTLASALLVIAALASQPAAAEPQVYADAELAHDKRRYSQKFDFLLHKGLLDFMTGAERAALRGVVVTHPLRGAGPLAVSSSVVEGTPMIRAPVMSLKFIEDLSVAYAWRHLNGHSLEPIDEYLVTLKHGAGFGLPTSRPRDPLTALGVPPKIWERDRRVDDLSLRFRNTAWAFILAHELGHLRLGHTQTNASSAVVQRQEEAADDFAVDLLGRSDTIPMGMLLWFQATAGYMKNRADFRSDAAYVRWMQSAASHPVNGSRMINLAAALRHQAASESDVTRADVLDYIAVRLAAIGEIVEDPDMQLFLKRCAASRRPEELTRLHDRACS